jgi:GntR family transcriptional regulator
MVVNKTPPIAEQVHSVILQRIREGVYTPGERMPSESEFAAELEVSRSSVRTALTRLETTGLITRRHGEGAFVNRRAPEAHSFISDFWEFSSLIKEMGRTPRVVMLSSSQRTANQVEAAGLEIMPGEPVFEFVRMFYAENDPVIHTINVVPTFYFKVELDQIDGTRLIDDLLEAYCGLQLAFASASISAVKAPEEVTQHMHLDPCSPLLRFEEVFFNLGDETPVLFSDSYLNTMKLNIHRVRPWQ